MNEQKTKQFKEEDSTSNTFQENIVYFFSLTAQLLIEVAPWCDGESADKLVKLYRAVLQIIIVYVVVVNMKYIGVLRDTARAPKPTS